MPKERPRLDPEAYYDELGRKEWDRLDRDLGFEADAFDATLCLGGPLSHVTDDAERETAARELRRVTRPGRPVFVSVMGRLAVLLVVLQHAGELPEEHDETELLLEFAAHGTYDRELLDEYDREPTSFAVHRFRVAELEELLESTGLVVEQVVGLENVASVRRGEVGDITEGKRAAVSETVRMLREDRSAADLSSHVLAVARGSIGSRSNIKRH